MKILVAITSYGKTNDRYLSKLIQEYRGMRYDIDLIVFSNIPKDLGSDVEVIVGLPTKNPRSLPFAHKKIFSERVEHYDLFIYSEDDTLISQRNIEAFIEVTPILPRNKIAGFIRSEQDVDGGIYFSTVHSHYHWDPASINSIGDSIFAHFTNEHSACYILAQEQLRYALKSGGFCVAPHEGKYDLLVTAATDPYTQCGFEKVICISHLEDFTVYHLPNKYIQKFGLNSTDFYRQIDVLLNLEKTQQQPTKLFDIETKLPDQKWSKCYYEDRRLDILPLLPRYGKSVLSVGCGWGATEEALVKKGIRVVAIPLDSVIAACAAARGVEIVGGDLKKARDCLEHERFDGIILPNILHVVRNPIDVLASFSDLLAVDGRVVVGVPNFSYLPTRWRRLRHAADFKVFSTATTAGLQLTTHRMVRKWFTTCQLTVDQIVNTVPQKWQPLDRLSLGLGRALLTCDFVVMGRKYVKKRDLSQDVKSSEQFAWRSPVYHSMWNSKLSTAI